LIWMYIQITHKLHTRLLIYQVLAFWVGSLKLLQFLEGLGVTEVASFFLVHGLEVD
jgi:hypothetical protein